jgi:uncharacterized membrane protein
MAPLHPAFVHLPIVLVDFSFVANRLGLLSKASLRVDSVLVVWLGPSCSGNHRAQCAGEAVFFFLFAISLFRFCRGGIDEPGCSNRIHFNLT